MFSFILTMLSCVAAMRMCFPDCQLQEHNSQEPSCSTMKAEIYSEVCPKAIIPNGCSEQPMTECCRAIEVGYILGDKRVISSRVFLRGTLEGYYLISFLFSFTLWEGQSECMVTSWLSQHLLAFSPSSFTVIISLNKIASFNPILTYASQRT